MRVSIGISLLFSIVVFVVNWAEGTALFENGVNLQPSYYNNGDPNFGWSLMKNYKKIKTVRIEIEPSATNQAKEWIAAARKQGYFVIATYHDYQKLGSDNQKDLSIAANWWENNYHSLTGGNSTGFIVNLMNEWGSHGIPASSYAEAYNNALSVVRNVYQGKVIIDLPGWGQETDIAAKASSMIRDTKIIFSAHVYPSAWNQQQGRYLTAADLNTLNSTNRPCIIGEFGTKASGGADVEDIVKHAKSLGWPVIGWAWNGDGQEMNMVQPSWANKPTATSFEPNPKYFPVIYDLL